MVEKIVEVTPDKGVLSRVGFTPDIIVHVVGTSFEGRQDLLLEASNYCTSKFTPPAKLIREQDNKYDPDAVAVYIGVDFNKDKNTWTFEHVGYLPKGFKIPYKDKQGGYSVDPKTGLVEYRKVSEIIDSGEGTVQVGVENILENNGGYGLRVGLRHWR